MTKEEADRLSIIESVVSDRWGIPADELRHMTVTELRERAEARTGKRFKIVKHFPFIGRGNVLRDRIKTTEEIDSELDKALTD